MSLSMYQASIPVFVRGLNALRGLLEKGAAHAAANGTDPNALVSAQLAPDMLPLAGQVQRASDTSKLSGQRLSGVQAPSMPDTETTLDQLIGRVNDTIAYLETIDAKSLDGAESRTIELNFGPGNKHVFRGDDYLLGFALPNFYFHVAIAHGILRSQGVGVGKLDYIGAPPR
ncbi:hypothetical protein ASE17_15835 [Phenylobacterium sp. Root77]|uniref:DUF1993 domain-containing protein n=1 Tax=unclassified Phenylobacterium TaxID=2640670 RepID=UPI0006FBA817|nr:MULTISPECIES: DUF1993 domain-containing protein [unclassified Phenylobacterium]KQW70368.1 hypothetical protein ASC73_09715 [Phenylobacterium sp. Root1277]KQW91211.1 hypothetical protein ASC79_17875 [Phenylobacterium sp. Root1290]KRC39152.1 hypothetical protein ASE17_15835 [Phenylobacterium sp. Root77]